MGNVPFHFCRFLYLFLFKKLNSSRNKLHSQFLLLNPQERNAFYSKTRNINTGVTKKPALVFHRLAIITTIIIIIIMIMTIIPTTQNPDSLHPPIDTLHLNLKILITFHQPDKLMPADLPTQPPKFRPLKKALPHKIGPDLRHLLPAPLQFPFHFEKQYN